MGNGTLTVDNSVDYVFSGYICDTTGSGSGTLTLIKEGGGILSLKGKNANLYTGGTVIEGGSLEVWDAVPSSGVVDNAKLEIYLPNKNLAYDGVISGSGQLVKSGKKLLVLSGSESNTYTGGTTVSGGTLYLEKTDGAIAIPGDVNLTTPSNANTYLQLGGDNQIDPHAVITFTPINNYWANLTMLGHAQTVAGISDSTGHGVIENTETETSGGAGVLTVNNTADYSFNGWLCDTGYVGNGALTIVKTGSGELTLSGSGDANALTGGLKIADGTVKLGNANALGSITLDWNDYGGTLDIGDFTAVTLGGLKGSQAFPLVNALDQPIALTVGANGGNTTFSGVLSGGGSLVKAGDGIFILSGQNTFTGGTTITGGTLQLGAEGSLPMAGAVQIGDLAVGFGTLDLNGYDLTLSSLYTDTESLSVGNGWGGVVNGSSTAATLTVNNADDNVFGGSLSGNLTLVKSGSGNLTLTPPGVSVGDHRRSQSARDSRRAGFGDFSPRDGRHAAHPDRRRRRSLRRMPGRFLLSRRQRRRPAGRRRHPFGRGHE